jgi:TatD DNase family protein
VNGRLTERPPVPDPLPAPVVDNHCHLDITRDAGPGGAGPVDPTAAIAEAAAVGVPRIVQIGCDLRGARWAVEAAATYDALVAGVALHPNEAPRLVEQGADLDTAMAEIEALAGAHDKVRAVGETGLDHFRTGEEGRAVQVESFRRHIDLARRLDKTLVIHDRDAHEEVLRVLDEEGAPDRWVMHCFSGDADFARACLDRGAYLSFAGTVTFKNAQPLRDALLVAPRDRLLVETDAPYLTPHPHRGQANASYLVPLTVRAMAEVRGDDLETLCLALDATTEEAFGGPW